MVLNLKETSNHDGRISRIVIFHRLMLRIWIWSYLVASLSRSTHLIFNKSLSTGTFPLKWKTCVIYPLYKGDGVINISNYRPIAILNVMPKCFAGIIIKKLLCLCKNIIIPAQRSFVVGYFYWKWSPSRCHLYRFSKSIRFGIPSLRISKLYVYGLSSKILEWLCNLITSRSQIGKFNNFYSNVFKAI